MATREEKEVTLATPNERNDITTKQGLGFPIPADGCPWIVDKGCAGLVPDTPPSWSTVPPRQAKVPGFLSFAGGMELHHLVLLGVFVSDTAFQKTHLHVKKKRKK